MPIWRRLRECKECGQTGRKGAGAAITGPSTAFAPRDEGQGEVVGAAPPSLHAASGPLGGANIGAQWNACSSGFQRGRARDGSKRAQTTAWRHAVRRAG